jgi:hypothetical protein
MKEFDTLVIIGDSFCANRALATDWPTLLGKLTGCTVKGQGLGGNSWWSSKKYLDTLDHDKSKTVLIICHTESSRLPNDYNLPITLPMAAQVSQGQLKGSKLNPPVLDSLRFANAFYESNLFSPDFYTWAHWAWVNEINSDSEYYAIINMLSLGTPDLLNDIKNKSIVVYPMGLIENQAYNNYHNLAMLSRAETNSESFTAVSTVDTRSNHFNEANNINFANALVPIIESLQRHASGIRRFNNLREWDLDPNGIVLRNATWYL